MHRRCIICGQDPGDQCVYPRSMTEARRWQNLANLSSFDVDTESLCQYGCVCASHLDMVQESNSDPGSTSDAASAAKSSGGKLSTQSQDTADEPPSVTWSSSGTGQQQPSASPDHRLNGCYYPTNNKAIAEMQSKQSLDSRPQERSRCRGATILGNSFSQMGQNIGNQQPPPGTAQKRNLKTNQTTYPERCTCFNCPLLRTSKNQPEECTCLLLRTSGATPCRNCSLLRNPRAPPQGCPCRNFPLRRNSRATPQGCRCGNCPPLRNSSSSQRTQRIPQQENTQQSPRGCDRCSSPIRQKCQRDDELVSSASTTTFTKIKRTPSSSSSRATVSHQKSKPSVRTQCCQASINSLLKDQEVQCSTQPRAFLTARVATSFSQRSAGLAGSKGPSSIGNINMSNFGSGGEQQPYSNAINVLLMNGSRQNNYGDMCCGPSTSRRASPPPEICVQESDLADCNERAVFPEIDKPNYRACRAATSDPKDSKGKEADQNEANVLVLEEGPIDGCNPEDKTDHVTGPADSSKESLNLNPGAAQRSEPGPLAVGWINEPAAANYTKVLELQRVRINELENLLQQHNQLQQTIQARMAELQCTETTESANRKRE